MQEAVPAPPDKSRAARAIQDYSILFLARCWGWAGVGSDGMPALNKQVLREDALGCVCVNRGVACVFLIGWESISVPLVSRGMLSPGKPMFGELGSRLRLLAILCGWSLNQALRLAEGNLLPYLPIANPPKAWYERLSQYHCITDTSYIFVITT